MSAQPEVPTDGAFDEGDAADEWVDPVLVAEAQWRSAGWEAGSRMMAALSILRVEEIVRTANMAVLKQHELTHARHAALALLFFSKHGEMPLSKLSTHLVVHPTSVTATVDALERAGYVERVAHPTDRRTTLARITAAGREAIEATSSRLGQLDFTNGALDDDELRLLYRLLAKVRYANGEIRPAATSGSGDDIDREAATALRRR